MPLMQRGMTREWVSACLARIGEGRRITHRRHVMHDCSRCTETKTVGYPTAVARSFPADLSRTAAANLPYAVLLKCSRRDR